MTGGRVSAHPTVEVEGILRPTHVEVDLDAIARNVAAIDAHVGTATVMPVLKANAYGHGLVEVARHLEAVGVRRFSVAYLEEALVLRRAGISAEILVLGGVVGTQVPHFLDNDISITVPSVDKLHAVDAAAAAAGQRARVHLKIDTGMERIGIHWYNASRILEESLRVANVDVEGVFSHLANSDAADLTHARLQVERFQEVLAFYDDRSLPAPTRHLANSGGILALPESHLDMVRPGIMTYGVYPSPEVVRSVAVEPAARWLSEVVYFKVVEAGNPVSYGSTWAPDEWTRVVTVPVGYGDGYFRAASNRSEVLIDGRRYPVVGRVCMDQLLVDIGRGSAYNGDEVVLLGRQGDDEITAEDLADRCGTIAYEVLTNINARVPRVYV